MASTTAGSTKLSHAGSRPVGLAALTMPPYTFDTMSPVSIDSANARRNAASSSAGSVVLGISIAVFAESMYGSAS